MARMPGIPIDEILTPAQVREIAESIAERFLEQMDSTELGGMALARTIEARSEPDALQRQNTLREGQILATLALRDAIAEVTATAKEIANRDLVAVLRGPA